MIDVVKAASYIYKRYKDTYGKTIDEMKLHKLLYFSQRECIIMLGEPMFAERFAALKYGPVMIRIRDNYRTANLDCSLDDQELKKYEPVFDSVFGNYASKSSWSLSLLSHGESSWLNARKNIPDGIKCTALISIEDIRSDAERMRLRRFYFNEILPKINANKS